MAEPEGLESAEGPGGPGDAPEGAGGPEAGPESAGGRRAGFEQRLRVLRQDLRNDSLPGLLLCWASLAGLLLAAGALPLAAWALLWVPIGLLQYRIVLSGHEAVHRTLCRPLWLNELLGVAGQSLVGVNFASYRVQHLDHHRAGDIQADPDGHIYGRIIRAPKGVQRWLTWTLGTAVEVLIKIRQKGVASIGGRPDVTPESVQASRRHSVYVVLTQLGLIGLTWAITGWFFAYALLWIGPLFTVAVFLNRSRILVEHGLPLLAGVPPCRRGIPTVDVVVPWWEAAIFSPFSFNYHCCHHLYMTVPHHNLPQLRDLLREFAVPDYYEEDSSYLRCITKAMRA